ncbi:CAP domain-containing protein [Fimicolochytrium jonesii]|uniref:CAP domain-containing protein n=1 Tax=Fimicolochytrium jonesii TaxID=1396493 RepID=UPI0022FEC49F|nr:CAP domain-containing protein [Fimicolochytrium jonesii]KAI8824326.1 CAP domain-containing protein [Fimicolochytrium jonesii]
MVKLASVLLLASAALVAGKGTCKKPSTVQPEVTAVPDATVPPVVSEPTQPTVVPAFPEPAPPAEPTEQKPPPKQEPKKTQRPVAPPPKKTAAPTLPQQPPTQTKPTKSSFTTECLTFHNQFRAQDGKRPLTFSSAVARSAQNYAQVLANADPGPLSPRLVHSNGQFGENLYAFAGPNTVGCDVASKSWYSEKSMFPVGGRFGDNNGKFTWHDYGHYTQMVWGTTKELGCGVAVRDYGQTKTTYVVCQYNAPGNYIGSRIP